MVRREKFQVIFDILRSIQKRDNIIKPTPLLYSSNLSPKMHKNYLNELLTKGLILEVKDSKQKKCYSVSESGFLFIEKYKEFRNFVDGFGL